MIQQILQMEAEIQEAKKRKAEARAKTTAKKKILQKKKIESDKMRELGKTVDALAKELKIE